MKNAVVRAVKKKYPSIEVKEKVKKTKKKSAAWEAFMKRADESLVGPYTAETKADMDAVWAKLFAQLQKDITAQANAGNTDHSVNFEAKFNFGGKVTNGGDVVYTEGDNPSDERYTFIKWTVDGEDAADAKQKLMGDVMAAWQNTVEKYKKKAKAESLTAFNVAWHKTVPPVSV